MKICEEGQSPSAKYLRTMLLENSNLKLQVFEELPYVLYFGHPSFVHILELRDRGFT